jgi:hypothetical protein
VNTLLEINGCTNRLSLSSLSARDWLGKLMDGGILNVRSGDKKEMVHIGALGASIFVWIF